MAFTLATLKVRQHLGNFIKQFRILIYIAVMNSSPGEQSSFPKDISCLRRHLVPFPTAEVW